MTGTRTALDAFVDAFNHGDLAAIGEVLSDDYFGYTPQPGEPTQADTGRDLTAAIRAGFPGGVLAVTDVIDAEEDGALVGRVSFHGEYRGDLFGSGTAKGQRYQVQGSIRARSDDAGRISIAFEGVNPLAELRTLGVLPYPAWAHERQEPHPRLPEVLVRLMFNRLHMQEKECAHLGGIQVIDPDGSALVCQECVASGDDWPALRMCLTCGYVGCCDASVNQHVLKHHQETGHPLIRTVMPGEAWIWCYPDAAILSSRHLDHARQQA